MTTSLLLFENSQVKREPVETTTAPLATTLPMTLPGLQIGRAKYGRYHCRQLSSSQIRRSQSRREFPPQAADVPATDGIGEPPAPQVRSSHSINLGSKVATKTSVGPVRSTSKEAAESVAIKTSPEEDSPQSVAFNFYEKGLTCFDKGDLQGAISAFLVSVKFAPSAEVYLSLGNAYLKQEKNGDALKAFKESVNLNVWRVPKPVRIRAGFISPEALHGYAGRLQEGYLQPTMTKVHYGLGLLSGLGRRTRQQLK